jgi:hypothetical protein
LGNDEIFDQRADEKLSEEQSMFFKGRDHRDQHSEECVHASVRGDHPPTYVVAREKGVDVSNSCTIALYRSQLCDRQCVPTATLDAMKAKLPELFDGHTSCRSLQKFLLTQTKSPRNEIDSNDSESQSETEVEMEFDENATACASLTGETLRRSKRRVTSKLVTPRTRDCHSSSPWTESHSRMLQADRECWRGRQF